MKPQMLLVIALIASLLLAMPAWADGAADGGSFDSKIYNGNEYRRTAPPPDADLNNRRPSDEQLGKYYKGCYRHNAPFGTPTSRIVRPGDGSLWEEWYCPATKPSPTPPYTTHTRYTQRLRQYGKRQMGRNTLRLWQKNQSAKPHAYTCTSTHTNTHTHRTNHPHHPNRSQSPRPPRHQRAKSPKTSLRSIKQNLSKQI